MFSDITTNYKTECFVQAQVSGIEPVKGQYTKSDLRPEHIAISYYCSNNDAWEVSAIRVSGPRIKKDGTDSKTRHTYTYYGASWAPEWVQDFVNKYTPMHEATEELAI